VAFCPGLRFVLDCVLPSIAFCSFKDQLLCFAKDKLCQTQNRIAFCLVLRFASEDCVLKNLAFCLLKKNLAFCLRDIAFCPSQFLRFVKPNGEALRKCILSGPYKPTTVLVQAIEANNDSLAILEHTTVETPTNMPPENKSHFLAEKEAIHLILTGIGDDIYSTVDASQTAQEMWESIERFQQGQRSISSTTSAGMVKIKKSCKTTNNNLRTSLNSKNKNVDTTLRYKNDDYSGQFGTQRTVNVVAAREKVGSTVVQQSGIQCFNCREFGHFAKEYRKTKMVKDSAYHKEKMLLCKQAKQGVSLQAEQYDWLTDTDEEVDEQELEAHYSYMTKIQEVPTADSGTDSEPVEQVENKAGYNVFANHLQHSKQSESVSNTCLVETDDSNVTHDSPDMCEDDIQNDQNDVESDDERVVLANLIANLKLDVEENKKIQKQLKKANTSLAQELKECKAILAETMQSSSAVGSLYLSMGNLSSLAVGKSFGSGNSSLAVGMP
nr:hypothetical protein [Tanacetum cinerariifolium]